MSIGIYAKMAINPFIPNLFSHPYQLDESISNLGLLGGIFHFYLNFKRNFCKQIVENLIRPHVLQRLIWFCTVCRRPIKRMLGLYGLTLTIVCSFTGQIRLLSIMINFKMLSPESYI